MMLKTKTKREKKIKDH